MMLSFIGSIGYLAVEQILNLTITDKTDVYSFGMVLLEVVCGRKYMKLSTEVEFLGRPAEEKVDPKIKGKIAPACWQVFTDIVQGCVKYEADERPTMGEVEVQLEYALWLQEQADITNIHGGSIGYLAVEQILNLTITDKTDVYSFGMVLLEVVCGRKYMKLSTEVEFLGRPAEEKVDPKIKGKIAPACWQVFTDIVQGCVKYEADERPTMGEVEVQLEYALWLQEQADITNIHGGDYVLLSETIINLKP
ncbi:interleukin-1 receptor-associated kinase 4 [Vigna unguiculata]|uniref:Interleukin-1 receptor-associated kinase 4 n=1 Tax=Vigna unguiculata TaxID=3917 RepID=A0A4D6NFR7_VIGUN|nr:interleukin-1 receptor-associated kinase 4 [Vigna unguiculata]